MTLYLYQIGANTPALTIENAVSYTADQVVTEMGAVLTPLSEGCELSATADCAGTLRADWRSLHPSDRSRIEELETLMAELLFGGESV